MAILLPWLSLGACLLLVVLCASLAWDARGQRKTNAALRSQVAGLSQASKPTAEAAPARRVALPSSPVAAPLQPTAERGPAQHAPATAPAMDDLHGVEGAGAAVRPPASVLDIFLRRIAHSAQTGVKATHCGGARCGGQMDTICECPCEPCNRRRTLLEHALADVYGPQASAAFTALRVLHAGQHAALVGRVVGRYSAPREPAAHCGGLECLAVGAATAACACSCAPCRRGPGPGGVGGGGPA